MDIFFLQMNGDDVTVMQLLKLFFNPHPHNRTSFSNISFVFLKSLLVILKLFSQKFIQTP